jgi:hypothetical protein
MGNLFSDDKGNFDDSLEPMGAAGGAAMQKAPPIAGGDDGVEVTDGEAAGSSVPRKEGWPSSARYAASSSSQSESVVEKRSVRKKKPFGNRMLQLRQRHH